MRGFRRDLFRDGAGLRSSSCGGLLLRVHYCRTFCLSVRFWLRRLWLPGQSQCIGYIAAELDQLCSNCGVTKLSGPIISPIEVLSLLNNFEHWILLPSAVVELGHGDVEDRKNKVAAAKLCLSRQKRFKFECAITATYSARRHDWNKEDRLIDRIRNFLSPRSAMRDGKFVLPNSEIAPVAAELCGQFDLNRIPKTRECGVEILIIFA